MRRLTVLASVAVACLATAASASALGAQRPDGSGSCAGFLANSANPNMGVLMKELIRPALETRGVTVGENQREIAQMHPGVGGFPGLLLCIPEL